MVPSRRWNPGISLTTRTFSPTLKGDINPPLILGGNEIFLPASAGQLLLSIDTEHESFGMPRHPWWIRKCDDVLLSPSGFRSLRKYLLDRRCFTSAERII